MGRAICVIPARMAATRFPNKPLAKLLGLEMILHIERRCRLFAGFERVVVATCDREIADVVTAAGGSAIMTSDKHDRATDRVQEAVAKLNLGLSERDVVVMVQGDEILVTPEMLAGLVEAFQERPNSVVNLISRIHTTEDLTDINTVKVVVGPQGRVLYMSRSLIPSIARVKGEFPIYQQTGIIAFNRDFLNQFSSLAQTPLEKVESIDMLRLLENELPIYAVKTEIETVGIDSPEDVSYAEEHLRRDPVTEKYLPQFSA